MAFGLGGDKGRPARPAGDCVETLIGARISLKGDLRFAGGLFVEGNIHGSVIAEESCSDAVLTLADKGSIHGEVRAPHVIVNGHLTGDIYATERIELGANARVQGNIHYKLVEMAAGAMVTGRMIHGVEVQKQLPKPEAQKEKVESGKERREAAV